MTKKALNLPILISLVVGNMIGTGIYALPASLAKFGTSAIIAWVFTSMGALLLALVYANMNKRFPQTGGPYVYSKQAFGRPVGFVVGFIYWASTMVSAAAIAVATTGYLGFIFPILDFTTPHYSSLAVILTELCIVWIFAIINLIGLHQAGVVQFVLTCIKVLPLIIISFVGIFKIDFHAHFRETLSHVSEYDSIARAASLTFWAFVGLEAATIPSEDTGGSRDIFIATISGTLIAGFLYLASTFVLIGLIPSEHLQSSQFPFSTAGIKLFGPSAAICISICAIASGLGALNSTILLQGQVLYAAARDKMFPPKFAIRSSNGVPVYSQLLSCGLVSIFLFMSTKPSLLKQFDFVAMLATLLTLFTYLLTSLADLKFSFTMDRDNKLRQSIKTGVIAMLATLYSLWTIKHFESEIIVSAAAITVFCIPVYYFTVRGHD